MSQGNDPAAATGFGEEPSRLPRAKKLATRQAAATSRMFLRRLFKGRRVTPVFGSFTSLLLSERYFYLLTIDEFACSSVTIDVFDSDYVHVALRMLMRKWSRADMRPGGRQHCRWLREGLCSARKSLFSEILDV